MINKLKILAVIPARGGSKGLPKKNIYPLNGKPLIAYSILAALQSKYIDKTVVSSDSDEILDVAKHVGAETVKRPDHLAADDASSESAVEHVLELYPDFDIVVLLQPTSPLRSTQQIDLAIDLLIQKSAKAVISTYEPSHTPFKAFKETKEGYLEGLVDNESPFMRRQDLPKTHMPNGAIFVIYTKEFLSGKSFFTNKTLPFEMTLDESVDIDTLADIEIISGILNRNKK